MTVASVINKAEIQLYSTLISVMSGINQLKTEDPQVSKIAVQEPPMIGVAPSLIKEELSAEPVSYKWVAIRETLLSLMLWIILGFAAGFLLGMISAG